MDTIPEPLRQLAVEGSRAFDCDPSFLVLPALSLAASCIGNTRRIHMGGEFYQPPVLWTVVVCPSGAGKSPPLRFLTAPLYKLQKTYLDEHRRAELKYEADLEAFTFRSRKALKDGNEWNEERPEKPVARRIITNDSTLESIYPILEGNPQGKVALVRDELGAFFGNMSRYKSSGSDLQGWLELYEGASFIVDRKSGDVPVRAIQHASVCIGGCIPPDTFQDLLTVEFLRAGLGARFCPAWPPERRRVWTAARIGLETTHAWGDLLTELLALDFAPGPERRPVIVPLADEAQAAWMAWYNGWSHHVYETKNAAIKAAYSKTWGHAARLALVFHVISSVWDPRGYRPDVIPLPTLQAATRLAQWFAGESARIYGAAAPEPSLIAWIEAQGGKTTVRDVLNAKKYRSSTDAWEALDDLVSTNQGMWLKEGKKNIFYLLSLNPGAD